jgi:hypothetical protein
MVTIGGLGYGQETSGRKASPTFFIAVWAM